MVLLAAQYITCLKKVLKTLIVVNRKKLDLRNYNKVTKYFKKKKLII